MKHTMLKKKIRIFGMLAMIAIIGVSMIKVAKAVEAPSVSPSTAQVAITSGQDMSFLPSVSVKNIIVDKYTPETRQISGSFVMSNDNDTLVGDLGYTASLIDAAPIIKPNTVVPENYQTYASQTSLNVTSLAPKEEKTVSFKFPIPAVPKNDYRVRIRVQTSKNIGLGWDNVDVSLGTGTGFIITPISWVAKTNDLEKKSYALDGLNVDPKSDVTLGFGYVNVGTKPLTVSPTIVVFETKTSGAKVFEQTGEKLSEISLSKKITQKTLSIKAPEKPGSYTIYLGFKDDNGVAVSDVTEYRLVVKGGSGKVLSAFFKELTANRAQIDVAIVGPADDSSTLEAITTVALFDGDKKVDEQTAEAVKLSGETGAVVPISFVFGLNTALKDPGIEVTLKDKQGNVLDSYSFKVPALKTALSQPVQPQQNPSNAKPSIPLLILGVLIAVLGVAGAIYSLIRKHTQGGTKSSTIVMMIFLMIGGLGMMFFSLPVVRAFGNYNVYFPINTPPAGAGNSYYFYGTKYTGNITQGLSIFVNKPNTTNQVIGILPANIPVQFDLNWSKCNNRGSSAGIAIDHLTAGGKIVPTVNNWVPFHALFPHTNSDGNTGFRGSDGFILGYNGTVVDGSNWTVDVAPNEYNESRGNADYRSFICSGECYYTLHTTYIGGFSVGGNLQNTTFRITGYKKHFLVDGTWTLSNWLGIYGWLNFNVPIVSTPLSCTQSVNSSNITFSALNGISANPVYKFLADSIEVQSGASSTYTTALAGAVGKSYTAKRCNSITPPSSPCSLPPTLVLTGTSTLRNIVNAQPGLTRINANDPWAGQVMFQNEIAQKICEWSGYTTVDSKGCSEGPPNNRCNYTSPPDNTLGRWNSSLRNGRGDVEIVVASTAPAQWLGSLQCSQPICSAGSIQTCETATCPVVVAPAANPTVDLTASSYTVNSGESINLTWTTTNAISCSSSGEWGVGTKASSGGTSAVTISGTGTKTYNITCNGAGGTIPATDSVSITINVQTLSCSATPTVVYTDTPVTFSVTGGSGNGYTWVLPANDGTNTASDPTSNTITAKFSKPGLKAITVSRGGIASPSCNPAVNVLRRIKPGGEKEN